MKLFFVCLCLIVFNSCRHDNSLEKAPKEEFDFLFLSHTYVRGGTHMDIDPLIKEIDFNDYDLLMLGGDLLEHTTQYADTFEWVNSIFKLDQPKTLWALGNHDYDNVQSIRDKIGGPQYFAKYFKGITFLVLDTQDSLSNFRADQLELIKNVTDTILESSHLIVLMHKLVWMVDGGLLETMVDSVCNGGLGTCFYCNNPNNFYSDVYPRLVAVKNRGIGVLCLGGDIGLSVQKYEHVSNEGIRFAATGLCSGCAVNYGMRFKWISSANELSYEYVLLTELVEE